MQRIVSRLAICLIVPLAFALPANAQAPGGVSVTCPDGQEISNGIEILVNMRPGFTYYATAIGLNGFDPVLAVSDQNGVGLCTDDDATAAAYSASLPSTGAVASSALSSQVPFSHSFSSFANISVIVGGFGGSTGEFLVLIEGLAVTDADGSGVGAGDPFAVRVTPNMVNSGVPLTVYMISVTETLDPMVQLVDTDGAVITDDAGSPVYCDDAGNQQLCWGQSSPLAGSFVSRTQGRQLGGFGYDAMLSLPLDALQLNADPDENILNFRMTSFQQSTFGDYVIAFHFATSETGALGQGGKGEPQPTTVAPITSNVPSGLAAGISVTCPDGQEISNGIEILVNMRPGFTYYATAIGLNGFDPVLAVSDQNGVGLCTDDDPTAAAYSASLPSTGAVASSALSSQVPFSHSFSSFANISVIVGGFGGSTGEFLVLIEGLAVTDADGSGTGAGDPFAVRVTPNMVNSGVPLTVYMISVTEALDPLVQLVDTDGAVITDDAGSPVYCDDAGNQQLCWGQSSPLAGAFVSRTQGRQLGGFGYDAMLSLPLDALQLNADPDENILNFRMTSFQQSTFGDYVIAFHFATAEADPGDV